MLKKNPKQEYKREAFDMFSLMQDNLHYAFVSLIFRLDYSVTFERKDSNRNVSFSHEEANSMKSNNESDKKSQIMLKIKRKK